MKKPTILFSSYLCDPFSVSEKYISFRWMDILLKQFNIILLTTIEAEHSVKKYYHVDFPENLHIISFSDKYPFKKNRIVSNSMLLGYFFFNYKIRSYLKNHPGVIDSCEIIFQKSPECFRYFTSLVDFDKPVYIGPISGGLKPPPQLRGYFKKEPFFFKLRNIDSLLLKLPMYKKQFAKAEKVLVKLDFMGEILPAKFLQRKVILLDGGINCAEYKQAESADDTFKILYVGRLTKYKGAELLIKALHKMNDYNFMLDIVGQGEEEKKLKALVKRLDLSDKVTFTGFIPPAQLKSFYQSASVFCLPTLKESLGNVFFEAMASGLPIITMNTGGPSYICPQDGAIKIPVTSEEGIINALKGSIISLMENPEKRMQMGRFNRTYCQENYDWKHLESKILAFFAAEIKKIENDCRHGGAQRIGIPAR